MNKIVKKEIMFAGRKLALETGELAMQANMAVKVSYGDTTVLVTVVSAAANPEKTDFFPLSVNYIERLYASGTIKNSRFMKRDGQPSDDAVIKRRLIDHAIRPLFPAEEGYMDEVQVVVTILSMDEMSDPLVASMIATSAALHASDIPWSGPMATARVGRLEGKYILNPALVELEEHSDMDLVVSFVGKEKRFLALEAEANLVPEEEVLGALKFAQENIDPVLDLINEFAREVNPENKKYAWVSYLPAKELVDEVSNLVKARLVASLEVGHDKETQQNLQKELLAEVYTKLEGKFKKVDMEKAFEKVVKKALQHLILEEGKRPDGRAVDELRELKGAVGVLPRVHGSSLFSRGETQILDVTTLGSLSMEQNIQDMYGERKKRYLHFYTSPPYAAGETGRVGGVGGREIGHGRLAEKALVPVIPSRKEFPYTIILQSEVLSSNGSTSMASTCASSLSLMDAGVPIKAMIAGISIGLVVNEDFSKYVLLTDIAGAEDGNGFMDFKMTGSRDGITAIQVDIKAKGLPYEMVPLILKQSHDARMRILDFMETIIKAPRESVGEFAPKTMTTTIHPEQIGMIIGTGGKVIKQIQEDTQTVIAIDEDGSVAISGDNLDLVQKAKDIIDGMTREVKAGEVFTGTVEELAPYGAFVEILPGKTGLLHISEISNEFVAQIEDVLQVGQQVEVKVLEVTRDGKYSLSMKAMNPDYKSPARGDDNGGNGGSRGGFRGNGGGDRGGFRGHDNRGGRGGDGGRGHSNDRGSRY
ncbi:polyribonucleotide nucleotidyltransferase [candidate division WWE3 bacterium]|nr:polyribonucleotide nucleotidyltransferase [candidate division WWE3 bacterium]